MIQQFRLGYLSKDCEDINLKRYMYPTPVLIATLFTIAKIWKLPKCPTVDEWIKKVRFIHAVDTTQPPKDEIWPSVTTWTSFEGLVLSE